MRLIDAERLRALIVAMYEPFPNICNVNVVLTAIDNAPTIEAEPLKHGRWILIGRGRITKSRDLKCSVCGNYFRVYDDVTLNAGRGDANFCPNCGADMREGGEQE